MGWLITEGQSRKQLVERLTRSWEHDLDPANYDGAVRRETVCLASCWKGNITHSGKLWTLYETRDLDPNGNVFADRSHRWICLFLCEYRKRDEGWGYKDIEETMGPCEVSCPLSYIERATEPTNEYSRKWREAVRDHAAITSRGAKAYNAAKVGDVLVLRPNLVSKADNLPIRSIKVTDVLHRVDRRGRKRVRRVTGRTADGMLCSLTPSHVRRNLGDVDLTSDEVAEAEAALRRLVDVAV